MFKATALEMRLKFPMDIGPGLKLPIPGLHTWAEAVGDRC